MTHTHTHTHRVAIVELLGHFHTAKRKIKTGGNREGKRGADWKLTPQQYVLSDVQGVSNQKCETANTRQY